MSNVSAKMTYVTHSGFALVAEWYTQQVEGLCREA